MKVVKYHSIYIIQQSIACASLAHPHAVSSQCCKLGNKTSILWLDWPARLFSLLLFHRTEVYWTYPDEVSSVEEDHHWKP